MTLAAFQRKWNDDALDDEDEEEELRANVRRLKHHQGTLKKGAKAYRDIAEHLLDIQEIKGSNVNISTNSESNNESPPPKVSVSHKKVAAKAAVSRKKTAVSSNENSPPPVFRATRKIVAVNSNSTPPRSKKSVVKPLPKAAPPSPETQRRTALEAIQRQVRKYLPRHRKRRSGSDEAFIPAAPSGSSASPEILEAELEFPDVLRAPHTPHEPSTPAHCGRLDIGFIDDWIHAAVRVLADRGEPEDEKERTRLRFTSLGLPEIYGDTDNAGDGSCLIHAFLTATSVFYRNLSNDNKAILGRAFRQKVYAKLYSPEEMLSVPPADFRKVPRNWGLGRKKTIIRKKIKGKENNEEKHGEEYLVPRRKYIEYVGGVADGHVHGFLYDTDVEKLAECFNVNIVLVPDSVLNIRYYEDDTPAGRTKPTIMIRNKGNIHFTTLHLDDKYIFDREEVMPLVNAVNARRNSNAAGLSVADRARYAIGRRVFVVGHPDEERVIQDIKWSNAGALPGQAVRVSHVYLESGDPEGQQVPVANIRIP